MSREYHPFRSVTFDHPSAIQFIGSHKGFEWTLFRIFDRDGKDTGYVGEFLPKEVLELKCFPVYKMPYVEARSKGKDPMWVPTGICMNSRLVAALTKISAPDADGFPNYTKVDDATSSRAIIPIPDGEDEVSLENKGDAKSKEICEWVMGKLAKTNTLADDDIPPPAEMIP